jgi:hypothetical protein
MKNFGLIVGVAAVSLIAAIAHAADDFTNTKWNSTYQSLNGNDVEATVYLYGPRGFYKTRSGNGKLYNVRFRDPNPDFGEPAGVTVVEGNWLWHSGAVGTFKWLVSGDGSGFSGTYLPSNGRSDNPLRPWNGKYSGRAN